MEWLSGEMAGHLAGVDSNAEVFEDTIKPFTGLIVQIDPSVLEEWALGECQNCTILKKYCYSDKVGEVCIL